ncbi:MAG: hypothetical protein BAJALOKI1v1_590021 [Promethearchaeota archaeon]|nr:MAG: hypothetical protein BAJALOKI1v1_590021 [Candidatus Lokiarchaeota archaeon]
MRILNLPIHTTLIEKHSFFESKDLVNLWITTIIFWIEKKEKKKV